MPFNEYLKVEGANENYKLECLEEVGWTPKFYQHFYFPLDI